MGRVPPLRRIGTALLCAGAISLAGRAPVGALPAERLQLAPRFAPGETLRYRVDFRSAMESRSLGPIVNPVAASKLRLSAGAVVRLEVLSADSSSASGDSARLLATYESAAATVESDAFDPGAAALERQYRGLAGHSIEFTVDSGGRLTDIRGLSAILPNERAASSALQWLRGLSLGAALPRRGIRVGAKWSADQPIEEAPLAGLTWRAESTYLRDEPCPLPGSANSVAAAPGSAEPCAMILTKYRLSSQHVPRDPTPPEYRQRGLRTRGKWSGSGESLVAVSLRTGWAVSVTQTGSEEMDVTVESVETGSRVRYTGHSDSQSQITLLSDAPAPTH